MAEYRNELYLYMGIYYGRISKCVFVYGYILWQNIKMCSVTYMIECVDVCVHMRECVSVQVL